MGQAREKVLLNYKEYLRRLDIARQDLETRRAIVAAGVYEDPIGPLNKASKVYSDAALFIFEPAPTPADDNRNLYEEWKQIFGKIEEEPEA